MGLGFSKTARLRDLPGDCQCVGGQRRRNRESLSELGRKEDNGEVRIVDTQRKGLRG